jgi:hypothetical protein
MKVMCSAKHAELSAAFPKGTRVVVIGRLIRGSWKTGEEVWWDEITLVASHLEVIR